MAFGFEVVPAFSLRAPTLRSTIQVSCRLRLCTCSKLERYLEHQPKLSGLLQLQNKHFLYLLSSKLQVCRETQGEIFLFYSLLPLNGQLPFASVDLSSWIRSKQQQKPLNSIKTAATAAISAGEIAKSKVNQNSVIAEILDYRTDFLASAC